MLLYIYFCLYNQAAVIFVTVVTFFSVGVHRESYIHASNSICIPLCIYIFILGGHLMPPPGLPSCPRAGPMPLGLNLRFISRIKLFFDFVSCISYKIIQDTHGVHIQLEHNDTVWETGLVVSAVVRVAVVEWVMRWRKLQSCISLVLGSTLTYQRGCVGCRTMSDR